MRGDNAGKLGLIVDVKENATPIAFNDLLKFIEIYNTRLLVLRSDGSQYLTPFINHVSIEKDDEVDSIEVVIQAKPESHGIMNAVNATHLTIEVDTPSALKSIRSQLIDLSFEILPAIVQFNLKMLNDDKSAQADAYGDWLNFIQEVSKLLSGRVWLFYSDDYNFIANECPEVRLLNPIDFYLTPSSYIKDNEWNFL